MSIASTVYLSAEHVQTLKTTAAVLGISANTLVDKLLTLRMKKCSKNDKSFSRIRYQNRRKKSLWKRLHVAFRPGLYEICLDVRKLRKVSVSSFLAAAIDKNLDEVIRFITKNPCSTDNYDSFYCISVKYDDQDLHYSVSHGKPPG